MKFNPFSAEIQPITAVEEQRGNLLLALSPERRQRISAYKPLRQCASLTGDYLCRKLVGSRCGLNPESLVLSESEKGQPCFPGLPTFVSITHAGDYAAAAAAESPIGLDLERVRSFSEGVYRRVLDETELDWVYAVPPEKELRFLRLWTMKEAYVKLLGQGFWEQPIFHAAIREGKPETEYAGFQFFFLPAPEGYVMSLCLQAGNA